MADQKGKVERINSEVYEKKEYFKKKNIENVRIQFRASHLAKLQGKLGLKLFIKLNC